MGLVYDASPSNQSHERPQYHSFRTGVSNASWVLQHLQGQSWTDYFFDLGGCFSGSNCYYGWPERMAKLVHISCLQLARKMIPSLTVQTLVKITQRTQPIISWKHMVITMGPAQPLSAWPPLSALSRNTELGNLVHDLQSWLPDDLQYLLSQYVSGLFRQLTNCLWLLNHVMESIRLDEPTQQMQLSSVTQPLVDCQLIQKLGVDTVSILGETCLARVGSEATVSYEKEICIADGAVSGLQVAFGSYGVVALRVLYPDGSTSAWLGGEQRRRFVTYRGKDLRLLRASSDVSTYCTSGLKSPSSVIFVLLV